MIELMKNTETLAQMGFGTKMLGCLTVALLGLGTCFVVLIVLMTVINLLNKKENKSDVKATAEAPADNVAEAAVAATEEVAEAVSPDTELDPAVVAVIAAAITKYRSGKKFRIVNIAPVENNNAWVEEGRSRAFANRGSRL